MHKVYNDTELRVLAMMRSGHHAIISWIIDSCNKSVYFRNDALEANILNKTTTAFEKKGDITQFRDKYIFNIEDAPLARVDDLIRRNKKLLLSGKSKVVKNIVIIRDPFNIFASRLKFERNILQKRKNKDKIKYANYIGAVGWSDQKALKMWIQYAESYIGKKKFLINETIHIDYNSWFSNLKYRKKISKELGLIEACEGSNLLSEYGGGSSFDGDLFKYNANNMNCLYRWRNFLSDDEYINLFKGNEYLLWLYKEIYGDLPNELKVALGVL